MQQMILTPLELCLGAAFLSMLTAVAVRMLFGSKFVTREEHEKDAADHRLILRMVRALVVHSSMPNDMKEEILNDRGSK
ncbi:MAG: hypothetical protein HY916_09185 [Desulfovibrio sp.]|jgi:hypothetical protein|nr:hypothetical protein [Desulfovibrio sp.]